MDENFWKTLCQSGFLVYEENGQWVIEKHPTAMDRRGTLCYDEMDVMTVSFNSEKEALDFVQANLRVQIKNKHKFVVTVIFEDKFGQPKFVNCDKIIEVEEGYARLNEDAKSVASHFMNTKYPKILEYETRIQPQI